MPARFNHSPYRDAGGGDAGGGGGGDGGVESCGFLFVEVAALVEEEGAELVARALHNMDMSCLINFIFIEDIDVEENNEMALNIMKNDD